MARAILFDNGDFSLHAQLAPVISPHDGLALTITSRREASRNPHEEQVCFFACLDRSALQTFADLIAAALQARADGEAT